MMNYVFGTSRATSNSHNDVDGMDLSCIEQNLKQGVVAEMRMFILIWSMNFLMGTGTRN